MFSKVTSGASTVFRYMAMPIIFIGKPFLLLGRWVWQGVSAGAGLLSRYTWKGLSGVTGFVWSNKLISGRSVEYPLTESTLKDILEIVGMDANALPSDLNKQLQDGLNQLLDHAAADENSCYDKGSMPAWLTKLLEKGEFGKLESIVRYIENLEDSNLKSSLTLKMQGLMNIAGRIGLGCDAKTMQEFYGSLLKTKADSVDLIGSYLTGLAQGPSLAAGQNISPNDDKINDFLNYVESNEFQFPETVDLEVLNQVTNLLVLEQLMLSPVFMGKYLEYLKRCFEVVKSDESPFSRESLERYYPCLLDDEDYSLKNAKVVQLIQNFINTLPLKQRLGFLRNKQTTTDAIILKEVASLVKGSDFQEKIKGLVDLASISWLDFSDPTMDAFLKKNNKLKSAAPEKRFIDEYMKRNIVNICEDWIDKKERVPEGLLEYLRQMLNEVVDDSVKAKIEQLIKSQ